VLVPVAVTMLLSCFDDDDDDNDDEPCYDDVVLLLLYSSYGVCLAMVVGRTLVVVLVLVL
jgi:hypothetical protein